MFCDLIFLIQRVDSKDAQDHTLTHTWSRCACNFDMKPSRSRSEHLSLSRVCPSPNAQTTSATPGRQVAQRCESRIPRCCGTSGLRWGCQCKGNVVQNLQPCSGKNPVTPLTHIREHKKMIPHRFMIRACCDYNLLE